MRHPKNMVELKQLVMLAEWPKFPPERCAGLIHSLVEVIADGAVWSNHLVTQRFRSSGCKHYVNNIPAILVCTMS